MKLHFLVQTIVRQVLNTAIGISKCYWRYGITHRGNQLFKESTNLSLKGDGEKAAGPNNFSIVQTQLNDTINIAFEINIYEAASSQVGIYFPFHQPLSCWSHLRFHDTIIYPSNQGMAAIVFTLPHGIIRRSGRYFFGLSACACK